ncbi:hypothetical protein ACYCSE_04100 [Paenibacillus sp. SEL1]
MKTLEEWRYGKSTAAEDKRVEARFIYDVRFSLTTYVEHRPFVLVQPK